jgi:hypothetical protein
MANDKPELKVDLFKSKASQEDLSKFDRVNIFKTRNRESAKQDTSSSYPQWRKTQAT